MASIIISDLEPAGANLFRDSESFFHELTEQEVGSVLGGKIIFGMFGPIIFFYYE
jgi:hypothetical protein